MNVRRKCTPNALLNAFLHLQLIEILTFFFNSRGLEDHTAKLLGNKHSYYIRREHLCAVMEEFHTQRWHGRYDPQRLCRVSEKSSFLRRKIAVERALADREAAI